MSTTVTSPVGIKQRGQYSSSWLPVPSASPYFANVLVKRTSSWRAWKPLRGCHSSVRNCYLMHFDKHSLILVLVLFFSGLSWHISYALLAHLFCLPIEWTSTAKELEEGGFFVSVERVIEKFKYVIVFMFMLIGCLIYFGNFAPSGYLISGWYYIVPISLQIFGHLGLPIFTLIF